MTARRHGPEDRVVAITLQVGSYGSFALITAGVLLSYAAGRAGRWVTTAGFLLLLATPVLRIVAALIMFLRQRDRRYALVAGGVLAIVAVSWWVAIAH